jgi:excisionase family DNA binding protein
MATVSAQYHGMSIYNMIGEHLAEADHTPALCSNSPPSQRHSRCAVPAERQYMPTNRRERRHPQLIGLPEAADYCDVSYKTIRRWISEGRLNAVRVGPRLLKVDTADLDKLLNPVGGNA